METQANRDHAAEQKRQKDKQCEADRLERQFYGFPLPL